ncbi:MntP/YtaF family protein [Parablautia muri]|uniref:hypothetical protein n=1 Tax=Parablautia muri TaxID=2320879 RepID=UPI001367DB28|nr:hypothetical protein [Parablautia muri]
MTFSIYLFLILVVVLSMDAFAAGLSYGMEGVRVPFLSIFILALLSGSMLTASLLAGNLILQLIPEAFTKGISFSILFLLSVYKFYDSFPHWGPVKDFAKGILHFFRPQPISQKKKGPQSPLPKDNGLTTREITKKINKEDTSYLSYKEASFLALALSIDNISAGLCTGTISLPPFILLFLTTAVHFLSIRLGLFAGHLLCAKSYNFAWLGAAILMLLAFMRLF